MKKIWTMLTVICVLVLAVACFAFFAMAEDDAPTYTGDITTASNYAQAVLDATEASSIISGAQTLDKYLLNNPIDPAADGYAAFVTLRDSAILKGAVETLNSYDDSAHMYECRTTISWVTRYLKVYDGIGEKAIADGETKTLAELYAEKSALFEAKLVAAKETLEKQVPLAEYDWGGSHLIHDFENGTGLSMTNAAQSGAVSGVNTEDSGNNYFFCKVPEDGANNFTYASIKIAEASNGIVLEFDCTYLGGSSYLDINTTENSLVDNSRNNAYFVKMNTDGSITVANGQADMNTGESLKINNAIVPGEWTHIAIAYNDVDYTLDYYLDYEYVGSTYARMIVSGEAHSFNLTHFRVAVQGLGNGFAIDNIHTYEGTAPRTYDRFTDMTDTQKFAFYINYMLDPDSTPVSIVSAYNYATSLLAAYWTKSDDGSVTITDYAGNEVKGDFVGEAAESTELQELVRQYYTVDSTEAQKEVRRMNSEKLVADVARLKAMERTLDTLSSRNDALAVINKFVSEGIFDASYAGYNDAVADLTAISAQITNDTAAKDFVSIMDAFTTATKYKKKKAYFDEAKAIYDAGLDETLEDASFKAALAAYALAPDEVYELLKEDNSKKLVMYITATLDYDSQDLWAENYDTLKLYVEKCREIVNSGDYTMDYDNADMEQIMEWYVVINAYFYDRLQEDHVAAITAYHDRYKSSDSYIEKLGICAEVARYFDTNDIDPENVALAVLKTEHEEYKAELAELAEQYSRQLDINSELFVSAVKRLSVAESYSDILSLLDEAAVYYYNMTVGEEEVDAAVIIYNEYKAYVKLLEDSSVEFVALMSTHTAESSVDDEYAILAEGAMLLEYLEPTLAGVGTALEKYHALYNEYKALLTAVNSELAETLEAVCALRYNCENNRTLAIFAQLFK